MRWGRNESIGQLAMIALISASVAVRTAGERGVSFTDFKLINDRMRAGGYHRVRLTGGRGLDG